MGLRQAPLRRVKRSDRFLVRYEGEFAHRHSFGQVSREMALALLARPEIELRLIVHEPIELRLEEEEKTQPLLAVIDRDPNEEVDFHIRHHWPPNFDPPPSGRWILAQPWEYGSLPETWVNAFRDSVDDVWCFTRYVKGAFERAGFPKDRIPVIPHGVNADVFRPDLSPLPLPTERRFKLLYVGGTLERKGADLLLETYLRTFSRHDDVALIVKDSGTNTFYRGKTLHEEFLKSIGDPTRPEIVYLESHLSDLDLARLYKACDVLVAPYRREGFALPVLEAMACGLHVIATGGGATDDFLDGTCGSRIVSDKKEENQVLSDGTRCVAPLFFMEPDHAELGRLLRWAYEKPEVGKQLGREASKRARSAWTWSDVAERVVQRLKALSAKPIRRFCGPGPETTSALASLSKEQAHVTPEEPQKLKSLEVSLAKGELDSGIAYLEELCSRERIHQDAKPVLLLAEKALAREKRFALKGLSETTRIQLLERVRVALGRIAKPEGISSEPLEERVSLTMIVRNEEENIAACLKSVRDSVHEMVVVDTGSEDRTKVIASATGARVYDFPWVDHFARARNEAISRARGEWIFWMDADDRLDAVNASKLKAVLKDLPKERIVAYSMKVECKAKPGASPTVVDHVRLFPRHSALRWEYRVHENILPSINRLGGEVRWTDVTIHHYGYLDDHLREKKRLRDKRLLELNIAENPEDPFVHFNFGHSLIDSGELERAAFHLRQSISRSEPHYSQVKKAYALLAQVERNRGQIDSAIRVLEEGRKLFPANPELLYFSGIYLHEIGKLKEAAKCFERILATTSLPQEFSSFDVGILDHKSRHRLAKVCLDMGMRQEAERHLDEVRRSQPEYLPATHDLAKLWIAAGKNVGAWGLIEELKGKGALPEALFLEGTLLRKEGKRQEALLAFRRALDLEPRHDEATAAVVELSRETGDKERALDALETRARAFPRAVEPRYDIGRFLFECGRLIAALGEIDRALALEPRHTPSRELRARIIEFGNGLGSTLHQEGEAQGELLAQGEA